MIRLLLVDDHALFRRALANLLDKEPGFRVIGEAGDGIEAVKRAQALRPDLVLMDLHMPRGNGLHATRDILGVLPNMPIVILTISEEDNDVFEAIKAGARGYLVKNIEPEKLYAALRGVFRGEAPLSRLTAAKVLKQFAVERRGGSETSPVEELTAREREILECLATGLTNKEIGSALAIAENTVKNHMKNILGKLHLANRAQATAVAVRHGLGRKDTPPQ